MREKKTMLELSSLFYKVLPESFSCQPTSMGSIFELKGGESSKAVDPTKDDVVLIFRLEIKKKNSCFL